VSSAPHFPASTCFHMPPGFASRNPRMDRHTCSSPCPSRRTEPHAGTTHGTLPAADHAPARRIGRSGQRGGIPPPPQPASPTSGNRGRGPGGGRSPGFGRHAARVRGLLPTKVDAGVAKPHPPSFSSPLPRLAPGRSYI
jgi:hypothetical protein